MRLSLLVIVLALMGCANDQLVRDDSATIHRPSGDILSVPSGAFKYVAYDSSNSVVSLGWIRFNPNQRHFRGKWLLYANGDEGVIGPQNGSGTLEGNSEQRSSSIKIWINLNPRYHDHNVYISGNLINDSFTGNWSYGTIAGEVNGGRFAATKQP